MTGQAMPNYTEDPMLINFPSSNDTDLLVLKPMVVNLGKDLFRIRQNTQFALTLLIAEILSGKNAHEWVSMDFT